MKLVNSITIRLSALAAAILAFWSVLFYFAIIEEINDETDDSLEDYAETVMRRYLAGEPLPSEASGSNNQFYLHPVSNQYANRNAHIKYEDRNVYVKSKKEFEPARVVTYIFTTDKGQFMEIEVSIPSIDKDDLKESIFYWLVFLYAAIIAGIALLNRVATARTLRPLRRLLSRVENYRVGNGTTAETEPTNISEFRTLNTAFDQSVRRIEKTYEEQKTFIGNASHEMQTPLAVCQNRLEMLLDDGSLTEQQMAEIIKTMHTLRSLSKLNKSLLMLCRIDNKQFAEVEKIDLRALAARLLPGFEAVYGHKRIAVTVEPGSDAIVEMNPQLAETLVSNLIKNAFVHNVGNGRIRIAIDRRKFTIQNTGDGQPLDATKVFERFYHKPGNKASNGLGLALAKAVADNYGFGLSYRFEDGMHTFEIDF